MKTALLFFLYLFPLLSVDFAILSTFGQNATNPITGMDGSGNAVAIWIENGVIQSRTKLWGMEWRAMQPIASAAASSPCLFVDLNGNAIAVWLENGIVQASSKTLLGSWSLPTALSFSGASSPEMAGNQNGDVVAVWVRNGNVESATKLTGGMWPLLPDVIVSAGAAMPRVGIGNTGIVIAVWQRLDASVYRIYSARKIFDGAWSGEQAISDSAHDCINARVAVDGEGNAFAVWYRYDVAGSVYSNVCVQLAEKPLNSVWDMPIDISDAGIYNPTNLVARIALDQTGNAISVWNTSFDGSNFVIGSTIKSVGNQSLNSSEIVQNLYSLNLGLAINTQGEGDTGIVYPYFNVFNSVLSIQLSINDIQSYKKNYWSPPINLSIGTENTNPYIAGAKAGTTLKVVVAWESYFGGSSQIHAVVASKPQLQPPTNLSVVQSQGSFHLFTEYFNTLSWQPSPSQNIVAYIIYRNGTYIDRVDSSVLKFIDHNRGQNESVVYQIAAIDQNNIQSSQATVHFP